MDFGIGFISNNIMLPILDFFYGIVPSYGLAIIALTLVIRFALFPLNAGSIRNMRKMKITQPLMKKEQEAIKERYKDDPAKQQEEMSKLFQKFGNPLAGCFPLLVQMPVLFALFATLRGSPFSNINYDVNLQIFPQEQLEYIQPKVFTTKPQNIYITDGLHEPVIAQLPAGNKLVVGEKTRVEFQTVGGQPLNQLIAEHPETEISPTWQIVNGEDRLRILEDGTLEALMPGEVKLQGTLPGIAANKGFLFIDALGRVGAFDDDGTIHWDIVGMILFFGISLYVNQLLSGSGAGAGQTGDQQKAMNQITPVLFSGMFLFFPLPAGVLMYIVVANIFQTIQTFILSREPLSEDLQAIVEQQEKEAKKQAAKSGEGREALPFEPKRSKKKASS